MNKDIYTPKEVMEILSCSRTKAYSVIKDLNKELEGKGYYCVSGKISAKFFRERLCLN